LRNALVPLAPHIRDAVDPRPAPRSSADFIAQLIATSAQLPQTRGRRRAAPDEAAALYRALDRPSRVPGRALSRTL